MQLTSQKRRAFITTITGLATLAILSVALHAQTAADIPVTYLLAPHEGHGFGEAETSLAVNRATEQFLGKCLGGRVQPTVSPGAQAALKAMLVNVDTLKAN